jgi:23S rRNA pseudouridine955/2504/2580 synthase
MCADKAKPLILKVAVADDGQRLDRWLKNHVKTMSYVAIQKLLRTGGIKLNGRKKAGDERLKSGDEVSVWGGGELVSGRYGVVASGYEQAGKGHGAYQVTKADRAMIESAVVYDDKAMLVLNKPAGLPAQAGGGQVRSLDRILAGIYGEEKMPKLVHRLDRETTGLIVSGKNRTNAAALAAQFADRAMKKEYLAVVVGALPGVKGTVDAPIAKVGPYAKVDAKGDAALTTWRRLESYGGELHLLACVPHTGRMNQLRVHLAHMDLPMLGDDKYGGERVKAAWKAMGMSGKAPLFLHAWKLALNHPQSGERMQLEAPLPAHFATLLERGSWRP